MSRGPRLDPIGVAASVGRIVRVAAGMDLLVSYPWGRFAQAAHEVRQFLGELGEATASVRRSAVPGIAVVETALDARAVIRHCHDRLAAGLGFEFAVKWVPVDFWCATDLDAMRELIATRIRPRIGAAETWGMKVEKRGWPSYHTIDIVRHLAVAIDRTVNLDRPDWLVRVDVLGPRTAVSLLRQGEVFSLGATHL
jgi:tRNA(Ser,Leu) C12 N-acetylase TAN1